MNRSDTLAHVLTAYRIAPHRVEPDAPSDLDRFLLVQLNTDAETFWLTTHPTLEDVAATVQSELSDGYTTFATVDLDTAQEYREFITYAPIQHLLAADLSR